MAFTSIPNEILTIVVSYLDNPDLLQVALVSKPVKMLLNPFSTIASLWNYAHQVNFLYNAFSTRPDPNKISASTLSCHYI